jgi:hypothetical protein
MDDEKKLSGLFFLLEAEGKIATLKEVELRRVLTVDLVGHSDNALLRTDLFFTQLVAGDDTENLDVTYCSISFSFWVSGEGDFRILVHLLRQFGSSLKDSVE